MVEAYAPCYQSCVQCPIPLGWRCSTPKCVVSQKTVEIAGKRCYSYLGFRERAQLHCLVEPLTSNCVDMKAREPSPYENLQVQNV